MSEIGIGSTVWVRREYRNEAVERKVIAEHPRSWEFGQDNDWWIPSVKFPKSADAKGERWTAKLKRGIRFQVFLSSDEWLAISAMEAEARSADMWKRANREGIISAVRQCGDRAVLRQIAALVGYEPKESA